VTPISAGDVERDAWTHAQDEDPDQGTSASRAVWRTPYAPVLVILAALYAVFLGVMSLGWMVARSDRQRARDDARIASYLAIAAEAPTDGPADVLRSLAAWRSLDAPEGFRREPAAIDDARRRASTALARQLLALLGAPAYLEPLEAVGLTQALQSLARDSSVQDVVSSPVVDSVTVLIVRRGIRTLAELSRPAADAEDLRTAATLARGLGRLVPGATADELWRVAAMVDRRRALFDSAAAPPPRGAAPMSAPSRAGQPGTP
jgi:hypothetical protein